MSTALGAGVFDVGVPKSRASTNKAGGVFGVPSASESTNEGAGVFGVGPAVGIFGSSLPSTAGRNTDGEGVSNVGWCFPPSSPPAFSFSGATPRFVFDAGLSVGTQPLFSQGIATVTPSAGCISNEGFSDGYASEEV